MTKQRIQIGAINSGSGDTLRAAMIKINNNFDELYDLQGQDSSGQGIDINGNTITSNFEDTDITLSPDGTGDIVMDGDLVVTVIKSDDSTEVKISDSLNVTGTVTATAFVGDGSGLTGISGVGGGDSTEVYTNILRSNDSTAIQVADNLVPTQNETFSLGTADKRWSALHVAGDTIFLGNLRIKDTGSNEVQFLRADGVTEAKVKSPSSILNVVGDDSTDMEITLGTDRLFFQGGTNIETSTDSTAAVTIAVANAPTFSGNVTLGGDIVTSGNDDITLEPGGTGDILLKAGGQVGIGSVSSPDTSLHIKTAAAKITLQRTADANTPGLSLQNSGGNVRAEVMMDGTSGTSNEIFINTHDGSSLSERFRVKHTGAQVTGDLQVTGNFTVSGTTTSVNTTNLEIQDALLELSKNNSGGADTDAGLLIQRGSAGNNAAFYWNEGDDKFKAVLTTSSADASSVTDSSTATIVANLEGNVTGNVTGNTSGSSGSTTGNAATATALETARTIGGVSFDGTGNINLPGVNTAGNQNTSGTAAVATTVTVTDNESTNEENVVTFVAGADSDGGNVGLESDGNFTYNPSTGAVTATKFKGDGSELTGISGGGSSTLNVVGDDSTDMEIALGTDRLFFQGGTNVSTSTDSGAQLTISVADAPTFTGAVTAAGFTIGSAAINEAELETIDGVTAGTVAASKAVVVDSNKDAGTFRNITASGTVQFGSLSDGTITVTAFVDEDNMSSNSATLIPTQQSVKAYVDTEISGVSGGSSTLNVVGDDSTDMEIALGTDRLFFQGGTNVSTSTDSGAQLTISVADAPTFSGAVTAAGFTIGSAAINESELETIDGVTAGTVAASKAVVVDSNKDATGFRNVTGTGDVEGASLTVTSGVAITASSGDVTVANATSNKDLIFTVNDGGSATEVMRLDGDVSALLVASGKELRFADSGEKISGDGTDLTIASGAKINLTATSDVVVPANVGITFGTGEKIEGDNTDLTITSGAKINLTATSDIHIPNDVGIVFGGDSEKIEGDGTDLVISANNLTVDAAADIILDAGGNDFQFKAGGTHILSIVNSSSDVIIKPIADAKDIIFQQRDGTEVARIEDNGTFNVVTDKLAINGTAITSTAAELNFVDGSTAGTVVASKAVVVDSNKDASAFRNLTGVTLKGTTSLQTPLIEFTDGDNAITIADGGGITANTSLTLASGATVTAILDEDNFASDSDTALATQQSIKAYIGSQTGSSITFRVAGSSDSTQASVDLSSNEEFRLIGGNSITTTIGSTADNTMTVALDDNIAIDELSAKDSSNIQIKSPILADSTITSGAITSSGVVTATGFTIGSAAINEAELETIDGITAGTVAASKAVIVDANKDVTGFRNVTGSGDVEGASLTVTSGVGITASSGDVTVANATSNKDLIFTVNDGGSATEVMRLDGDVSAILVASGKELQFADSGEKISGDGTDLTIASGAKINLNATSDIHIPNDVGIVFGGDSEKIEGDGTDLVISANNLTVDAAADIILDAGGNDFQFKAGGTHILSVVNSSSDVIIKPIADAKDIIFQQRDGTEVARVEDNATFNVVTGKLAINGTAITSTAAELNLVDGITAGTVSASKAVIADSNKDALGFRNISATGTAEIGGDLQVGGNFTVSGTTTSVNTTNIEIQDALLELNKNNSGGSDVDAGIFVQRGSAGNNAVLYWNEGDDTFKAVLSNSAATATAVTDSSFAGLEVGSLTVNAGVAITASSGDVTVANATSDKDLIFTVNDGGSATEVFRLDGDVSAMLIASGKELRFADSGEKISSDGTDLTIASGGKINLGATSDVHLANDIGLVFGDAGEKIEGDGTDLTITGNNIKLTAAADVVIPANVGITFGTGEKIEGDSTDLTVTSGAKINLNATSDIHIPNDVGIVFGGASEKIEGDGTDLVISANNLTVDAAADIVLDAGGNDFNFKAGGTEVLRITNSSSDVIIRPVVDAKDIIFQQRDGTEVARVEDNGTFNIVTDKLAINGTAVTSTAAELNALDGITAVVGELNALDLGSTAVGTAIASKAVILDSDKDYTGIRNLTVTGSFIIGSADMSETDLEKLDGITNGTVAASKAVVVDSNKDAGSFRNITATGTVTTATLDVNSIKSTDSSNIRIDEGLDVVGGLFLSEINSIDSSAIEVNEVTNFNANVVVKADVTTTGSFIIGSASMNETDLEKLDGITNGAGAANKALVLDGSADVASGLRNLTASGTITGGTITLDGGFTATESSGDVTVANSTSNKDLIFTVNDGGSATEVFRLDGDVSALLVASGKELRFADSGEKISGDGTDLTIASGAKINLTATSDVVVPANVGITFGDGEKIEGDDTDLTITSGAKINLNATSDVHIPNDVGIVFGGDSEKIEGDGTDLVISANNLTVDAAADIILDAGGNDFQFKAGGTHILSVVNSSSDVIIKPIVDAKDIIFQQRDGTEVARIEDNGTFNVVTDKLAINGTAITSTAAELNALDGITAVVGELNALDLGSTAVGTAIASKAVILDSNKDYTGFRNITLSGELDAGSLDVSGDADIDGTLEADAITVNGTSLADTIAGTTVNLATLASTVTITDNESTNENNALIFTAGGDVDGGNLGLESDGTCTYNPSTGKITATGFIGSLTGTASAAVYSDLAERYHADAVMEKGDVVEIGGTNEITKATQEISPDVFGVISHEDQAAFKMNDGHPDDTHPLVALTGRADVKVIGPISKGDRLVTSSTPGVARKALMSECTAFTVIGKALQDKTTEDVGIVLCYVTAKS